MSCDDSKRAEAPPATPVAKPDAAQEKVADTPNPGVDAEPKTPTTPASETPTAEQVGAMVKAVSTPNWSSKAMMEKAHSKVLEDGGDTVISGMMDAYAEALGPVQSLAIPPLTLKVGRVKDKDGKDTKVVVFKADAVFAKSKGEINVRLMQEDGDWRIVLLSVESPELDALMTKSKK